MARNPIYANDSQRSGTPAKSIPGLDNSVPEPRASDNRTIRYPSPYYSLSKGGNQPYGRVTDTIQRANDDYAERKNVRPGMERGNPSGGGGY